MFDESFNCLACEASGKKRYYNPEGLDYYLLPADRKDVLFSICVEKCPEGYVTNQVDHTCDKCGDNEYSKNNVCKKCSDYSPFCDICNSNECLKCVGKTKFVNGNCVVDNSLTACSATEARDPRPTPQICSPCPSSCTSCHFETDLNGNFGKVCDGCLNSKFYDITNKQCLNIVPDPIHYFVITNGIN